MLPMFLSAYTHTMVFLDFLSLETYSWSLSIMDCGSVVVVNLEYIKIHKSNYWTESKWITIDEWNIPTTCIPLSVRSPDFARSTLPPERFWRKKENIKFSDKFYLENSGDDFRILDRSNGSYNLWRNWSLSGKYLSKFFCACRTV